MSQEINTILESYHFSTLWEMAHAAGLQVTGKGGKKLRKTALVNKMRAEFFSEARVRASWERLDKRERAIMNRLLLRGGRVSSKGFQREIVRAKLATPAREDNYDDTYIPYARGRTGSPRRSHSLVFEDVIARLTYHGLVFSRPTGQLSYKLQFHPEATLYIPEVIRRYLPEPEPLPVKGADWQPTRVQSSDPVPLLRDLYLYWDTVRRNEVKLIQAGLVGKRWLKAINKTLLAPDPALQDARREDETGRLYLLRQLLERLDLVHKTRGYLQPTNPDALHIPPFWSWDPAEQLSACLQAWLQLEEQEKLGDDAGRYGPRYAHARQVVLKVLKTLPGGVWFETEDFLERVQEQDANFLFAERTKIENFRGNWYYSYSSGYYYGEPQNLLDAMNRFETQFTRLCLDGFLHRAGAVELGYGSDEQIDEWLVFRLTPAGLAMLGTGAAPPPQHDAGKLIIQPNFQLLAIGPVNLAVLAQLDLFADRESADRGAFQYRLSRESVYRAQQQGMNVDDVIRFLEEASDTDLPQNVRRSLDEWAAHHERIVFRTGVSLLQAADAELLAELMDTPQTGQHLARAVSPQVALLKKNRHKQLVAALLEQHCFPAISQVGQDTRQSVVIHEDGRVQPLYAVPSLYLRGKLSRLAEERDGGWHITPESVRRAGGSKNKVRRLLDELRELQRGPFPQDLAEQIKAWGSYYGQAAAKTLTLIEFRDQATLDELRQHPELRARLLPFRAGERALAVVPENELEQVKQTLARLGIQVSEKLRR
jgi:hypothetical protein